MAARAGKRDAADAPGTTGDRRLVGAGPRRLDPSRDAAILQATLDGLADSGYDRLSMDDIAARARAGKGAIYRRWPSKAALVVDAIVWWRARTFAIVVPDTGSLQGDVEALIAEIPDFDDAARTMINVVLGVATAASRDPALAAALDNNVMERPRQMIRALLAQAVARGEVPPDRDLSLLPDIFVGLNILRLVTARPIDSAFIRAVFDDVIVPLATAPVPAPVATTNRDR